MLLIAGRGCGVSVAEQSAEEAALLHVPMVGHVGVADAILEDEGGVGRRRLPEVVALLLAGEALELFMCFADVGRAEGRAVAVAAEQVDDAILVERADALLYLRAEVAGEAARVALAEDTLLYPAQQAVRLLKQLREALDVREDRPIAPQLQGGEHILGDVRAGPVSQLDEHVVAAAEAVGAVILAFLEQVHRRAIELNLGAEMDGDVDVCLVGCALQLRCLRLQVCPVRDEALAVDVRRGKDIRHA